MNKNKGVAYKFGEVVWEKIETFLCGIAGELKEDGDLSVVIKETVIDKEGRNTAVSTPATACGVQLRAGAVRSSGAVPK